MTTEELDQLKINEALRRREADAGRSFALHLLDVEREGWTPPEPVDRWTLEGREVLARRWPGDAGSINAGNWDKTADMEVARAALQRGYEIGKAEADPLGAKVREIVGEWARGASRSSAAMREINFLIQAEREAGK